MVNGVHSNLDENKWQMVYLNGLVRTQSIEFVKMLQFHSTDTEIVTINCDTQMDINGTTLQKWAFSIYFISFRISLQLIVECIFSSPILFKVIFFQSMWQWPNVLVDQKDLFFSLFLNVHWS